VAGDLTWDGAPLAKYSDLSTKQDAFSVISEVQTPTYLRYTDEAQGLYLSYTTSNNVSNESGYQVVGYDTAIFMSAPNSIATLLFFQIDAASDVGNQLQIMKHDNANNHEYSPIVALTSDFQTITFNFTFGTTGAMAFHYRGPDTIKVRNIRIYHETPAAVAISAPLNVTGAVTCTSVVQTSDRRVKENIVPANLEMLQAVFDGVEVSTYKRTDGVEGPRVGFISNDVKAALPEDGSMDMLTPFIGNGLVGVDYARMCTVLWGAVKMLKQRVDALA
jgi:hypothetical protein